MGHWRRAKHNNSPYEREDLAPRPENRSWCAIKLDEGEAEVFARSALALKYDPTDNKPAPITESQILMPRRFDDRRPDLWSVFNRTQENLTKGGLHGRSANGRRQQTRPVQGIDSDVRLNRALWMLADGLRQLKA